MQEVKGSKKLSLGTSAHARRAFKRALEHKGRGRSRNSNSSCCGSISGKLSPWLLNAPPLSAGHIRDLFSLVPRVLRASNSLSSVSRTYGLFFQEAFY